MYSPSHKALSRLMTSISLANIREWDSAFYAVRKKSKNLPFSRWRGGEIILQSLWLQSTTLSLQQQERRKRSDIRPPRLWNVFRDKVPQWWCHNNLYLQEQICCDLNSMSNDTVTKQKWWHENSMSMLLCC